MSIQCRPVHSSSGPSVTPQGRWGSWLWGKDELTRIQGSRSKHCHFSVTFFVPSLHRQTYNILQEVLLQFHLCFTISRMVFLISASLGSGPIWVCLSCRAIQGAFELRHFSVALLASPSGSCPLIPLSSPIPLVRHLRAEASNSASGFLCKIAVRIACGAGKNHWLDSDWTNPTGYQPYIPLQSFSAICKRYLTHWSAPLRAAAWVRWAHYASVVTLTFCQYE